MTTFGITGIGGFIGRRLAERLVQRGDRVRGLELSREAAARLDSSRVDVVVGDLFDPDARASAFAGCDVVVHTAAIVEESGALARFRRVNVDGAVLAATSARASGARTFVHLSSVMVYGFSFPPFVNERGPLRGEGNPYCITKIESEAAVRALANDDFGVIVIRPGDVYGEGSVPWVDRPLALMRSGLFQLPGRGTGILNHVHVDNLIDGLLAAVDRARHGETFNLTDGLATTTATFFGYHARMLGRSRVRCLPEPLLRASIRALALGHEAISRPSPAQEAAIDYLLRPHAYGIGLARARLDFEPRVPLDEGMRRIAASYGLADPTPARPSARG